MLKVRTLVVLPIALLLAIVAVRAMVFEAPADHPLRALQSSFPGHPAALIDRAMRDIGTAAAHNMPIPDEARTALLIAARKAPLASEPYLVAGTATQMSGDPVRAERLLLAARLRNPRAPGPRYFLADLYLRSHRIAAGLDEFSALAVLSERASEPLAPALAAYARTPGAIPQLQQYFRHQPLNRERTLGILANDPANAMLVLDLAPPLPLRQVPPPGWATTVIANLVAAGDVGGADMMWRRLNGIADRGMLFDPQFRNRFAAPPFAWQLMSGSAGVTEADKHGGLDVVYYGREPTELARQLLRLAPGTYRLAMRIDAPVSTAGLNWTVACGTNDSQPLTRVALDATHQGNVAGQFTIPATGCPVQWLSLRGVPGDTSETAQLTISALTLDRLASGS